ncbi:MAG: tetratricopeptide repeat protein [Gemmatimonadetes bacterium]|nr:tetratricopeptide repeat protein [Gemmatimonadota bacterium]
MSSFLTRLKERKLAHWAVAYLAGAWLILQVLDLLASPFAWPALVLRAATVLLAIGFLAVLVLAWYHGEKGKQRVSGIELLMLTGILAIAAAATGLVARGSKGAPAPAEPTLTPPAEVAEQGSVAVLPFVNMSGDAQQEYFADGLTEELLSVLAQLPELRVASRTSAFAFKGTKLPVDSIAKALHVGYVLEGSVRNDGGRLRITAQLIDAEKGYHVWSESYDREVKSVFEVQDEIARAIVGALELRLGGDRATARLAEEETSDPEAHALVLQAAQLIRQGERQPLERAVALLKQAIVRDPQYARAHGTLSQAYIVQEYQLWGPREALGDSARAAADRALALDPQLAEAQFALGLLALDYAQDPHAAAAHFRRGIAANPGAALIYGQLGWVLAELKDTAAAVAAGQRAVALDPLSPGAHNNLGGVYAYTGQQQRAVEAYRAALALASSSSTMANLGISQAVMGRLEEARQTFEAAYRQAPDGQFVLAGYTYVLARLGRRAEAEQMLRRIAAQPEPSAYLLATAYAGLGDRARVLELLEKSVAAKEPYALDLGVDPIMTEFQGEPRVQKLLAKMGLQ